jgi:hypothetical protein
MTSPTDKTNSRRRSWLAALALLGAAAAGGSGCSRAHMSSYYGHSYAAWFGAQYVHTPTATSEPARRALSSLDAQEATAISKNYRKTVGGQDSGQGQGQLVMIGQSHGSNEPYTPPPSVPSGQ